MQPTTDTDSAIWRLEVGSGPVVATAIHDGHATRPEVAQSLALDDAQRLREEDPFTAEWTKIAPTRVIGTHSRFEVDLNRPRDKAVYRVPEDAWGLTVWKDAPDAELFQRSLAEYDLFYAHMHELFTGLQREYGHFVVYDLHSYNHRRQGPAGPVADMAGNPQVNIGTGTMQRERWSPVVDTFLAALRDFDFPGGKLDVRENVKFLGGHWPRWIHEQFPEHGVVLSIEFKKFFMDEWTGEGDRGMIAAIGAALASTVPPVQAALQSMS